MQISKKEVNMQLKRAVRNVRDFVQGFFPDKRCPNCEGSFFKKGRGALTICLELKSDESEEVSATELFLCLDCLEKRGLDQRLIREGLEVRLWKEVDIEMAMEAIENHMMGRNPYRICDEE